LDVLDRLAREIDLAYSAEQVTYKLYTFLRLLHAFKDYWGVKQGAEQAFKEIAAEAGRYVREFELEE